MKTKSIITALFSLLLIGCGDTPSKPRFVHKIPWIGEGVWLKTDTHIHTKFSDGSYPLLLVAEKAEEYGCDVIAFTDHADRDLRAATPEYFAQIRQARQRHPSMLVFAGLEWNAPPTGGDEHATLLAIPPLEESVLPEFRLRFDDLSRPIHESSLASAGLEWLNGFATEADPVPAIVFLNHPTRKRDGTDSVVDDLLQWRAASPFVVGFSGAPGHQNKAELGSYGGKLGNNRWDPAAYEIGGAWDELLQSGERVFAARAPSDFHNNKGDFWPGEFSETWVYAAEKTHADVLAALKQGSFFAAHGHIVRQVRLQVEAEGLERPAEAGEAIAVAAGSQLRVKLSLLVPLTDWRDLPNQLDSVELIGVDSDDAEVIEEIALLDAETVQFAEIRVPESGLTLRARGHRDTPDSRDYYFYTNPIQITTKTRDAQTIASSRWFYWSLGIGTSLLLLGAIVLIARSSSSQASATDPTHEGSVESQRGIFPTRIHFALGALMVMAFAVYGSYVPLTPTGATLEEALEQFDAMPWMGPISRSDFAVNILLLVPISFLLMGTILVDNRQWSTWLMAPFAVLFICVLLSFTNEFGQLFFGPRVSSKSDILAQMIGTLIGIVTWYLTGNALTQWARSYGSSTRKFQRLEWLLQAYLIGLLIYSLMPFEFALSPADIAKNIRDHLLLGLLEGIRTTPDGIYSMFRDVVLFVPVGALLVIWNRPNTSPRRSPIVAIFFGTILVVALEMCQLLVMNRYAAMSDVLLGVIGVSIGAVATFAWGGPGTATHAEVRPAFWPLFAWLISGVAYAIIPFFVYCTPMEWVNDPSVIQDRYIQMFRGAPFADINAGDRFIKGSVILRKLLLFAPLGGMIWLAFRGLGNAKTIRVLLLGLALVLVAGWGLTIELTQLYIQSRYADIYDVFLYTIGGGIGIFVVELASPSRHRRPAPDRPA